MTETTPGQTIGVVAGIGALALGLYDMGFSFVYPKLKSSQVTQLSNTITNRINQIAGVQGRTVPPQTANYIAAATSIEAQEKGLFDLMRANAALKAGAGPQPDYSNILAGAEKNFESLLQKNIRILTPRAGYTPIVVFIPQIPPTIKPTPNKPALPPYKTKVINIENTGIVKAAIQLGLGTANAVRQVMSGIPRVLLTPENYDEVTKDNSLFKRYPTIQDFRKRTGGGMVAARAANPIVYVDNPNYKFTAHEDAHVIFSKLLTPETQVLLEDEWRGKSTAEIQTIVRGIHQLTPQTAPIIGSPDWETFQNDAFEEWAANIIVRVMTNKPAQFTRSGQAVYNELARGAVTAKLAQKIPAKPSTILVAEKSGRRPLTPKQFDAQEKRIQKLIAQYRKRKLWSRVPNDPDNLSKGYHVPKLPGPERTALSQAISAIKPAMGNKLRDWTPRKIQLWLKTMRQAKSGTITLTKDVSARSGKVASSALAKRITAGMDKVTLSEPPPIEGGEQFITGYTEILVSTEKNGVIGEIDIMQSDTELIIEMIEAQGSAPPGLFLSGILKTIREYGVGKQTKFSALTTEGQRLTNSLESAGLIYISDIHPYFAGETLEDATKAGEIAGSIYPGEGIKFRSGQENIPPETAPTTETGQPPTKPPEPPKTTAVDALPDPGEHTPAKIESLFNVMENFLTSKTEAELRTAVDNLYRLERTRRSKNWDTRAQELINEGKSYSEAMHQARAELAGPFPTLNSEYFKNRSAELIEDLYIRLYQYIAENKLGIAGQGYLDALDMAVIDGKPLPPAAKLKLQQVFLGQPRLVEAISTGKPVQDIVEGMFRELGKEPKLADETEAGKLKQLEEGVSQEIQDAALPSTARNLFTYQPTGKLGFQELSDQLKLSALFQQVSSPLGIVDPQTDAEVLLRTRQFIIELALQEKRIDQSTADLLSSTAKDEAAKIFTRLASGGTIAPAEGATTTLPAILEDQIKQPSMFPEFEQSKLAKILIEIGWAPLDILLALKGINSSMDLSPYRQLMLVAPSNPRSTAKWSIRGLQALARYTHGMDESLANQYWAEITNRGLDYAMYEKYAKGTGHDFYRELNPEAGNRMASAEEYGNLISTERFLPKMFSKLPTTRGSEVFFVTVANGVLSDIWHQAVENALEKKLLIATGRMKAPKGGYDIGQDLEPMATAIADATGRASLGSLRASAPAINAFVAFSIRNKISTVLFWRHLLPYNAAANKWAWKSFITAVLSIGTLVWLGYQMKLWDVEEDPTSSVYGDLLLFNRRVAIDPWGGRKQFITLLYRSAGGSGSSAEVGKEYKTNVLSAIWTFIRSSFAPLPTLVTDIIAKRTITNEPTNLLNPMQTLGRIFPFSIWDIVEAWNMIGPKAALAIAMPAELGAGVTILKYGDWHDNTQDYFSLPANDDEAKKLRQKTRVQYRKDNPIVDAELFILGETKTVQTPQAAREVLRLMKEKNTLPSDIAVVGSTLNKYQEYADKGLILPRKTLTDQLVEQIILRYKGNSLPNSLPSQQAPSKSTVPTTPPPSLDKLRLK